MAALVHELTGEIMARGQLRGGVWAETFSDLAGVEPLWRALESAPGAVMTPYQRFDWVAAYVEAEFGKDLARQASALRIVVIRDAGGRPRLLLPMRVTREYGIRVARVIGAKHANAHMPLFASREACSMDREAIVAALVATGRTTGIDLYAFNHQPRFWDGAFNPLGATGIPCPSNAYGVMLGPDPEGTVRRAYSSDARKKLRAKERKLVELLGPVEHRVATTPEGVSATLGAFYAQKAARMVAMGLPDPYSGSMIRTFLERATAIDSASTLPAVEVHALVATDSGRILATFGGAVDRDRFSGMWTSFDIDPALSRFSPGDILLHRLIGQQTAAGRRALDLGIGEARYKASVCDETIEMMMAMVPVNLRGHLFARGEVAYTQLKRRIKRSDRLHAALARWRTGDAA